MELGIGKKNYVAIGIIIVNIIYFIFLETHGGSESTMVMLKYGAAFPENIKNGEYYRLVTSMFMHFGIEHIVNNMLILVLLGGYTWPCEILHYIYAFRYNCKYRFGLVSDLHG